MSELTDGGKRVAITLATSAEVHEWRVISLVQATEEEGGGLYVNEGVLVPGHLVGQENTIELRRVLEADSGTIAALCWRPCGTNDWQTIIIDIPDLRGGDTQ